MKQATQQGHCTAKHTMALIASILLALIASGCAGIGSGLESPRVSLSNFSVQESTGFETTLQVKLRVLNPNDQELNIKAVDCKLEVNNKTFAHGLSNTVVQVPAFGSATVPVTVYSSTFNIARGLIGLKNRDEISYSLKGKVRLDKKGWWSSKLPFDSTGTISIKELKNITLPAQN